MRLTRLTVPLVLAGVFLAGCATTKSAKKDDTEYEYVHVVGSNLPVKVPKQRRDQASANAGTTEIDPEALRAMQSRQKAPSSGN